MIPQAANWAVSLFPIKQSNHSMIVSIVTATAFFMLSSDGVYEFLRKKYAKWIEKVKCNPIKSVIVALFSANDVVVAIPKRTILFLAYLIYSILNKLGYAELGVDTVFVGVFIIGMDRIGKSWRDEKKKLSALGRKVYSEENSITDSIIE